VSKKNTYPFLVMNVAVLTVSATRTSNNDSSGNRTGILTGRKQRGAVKLHL